MVYFVRYQLTEGRNPVSWLVFREDRNGIVEFVAAFPTERMARGYAGEKNDKS